MKKVIALDFDGTLCEAARAAYEKAYAKRSAE